MCEEEKRIEKRGKVEKKGRKEREKRKDKQKEKKGGGGGGGKKICQIVKILVNRLGLTDGTNVQTDIQTDISFPRNFTLVPVILIYPHTFFFCWLIILNLVCI